MNKTNILNNIDKMNSFNEKLEYLNGLYLSATNHQDGEMVLDMLKQLRFWGK